MKEASEALSWEELEKFSSEQEDLINGPNNSYSYIRLFNQEKSSIRVVLYRDKHAWCPYCQKVWLWLEWKRIPYEVRKVTMRCYGKKESWYLEKVPSGIFPAIELDKKLITESDQILLNLEKVFGPLGMPLEHPEIINLRKLERKLFRAWCIWLCSPPSFWEKQASRRAEQFKVIAQEVDDQLSKTNSPWLAPSRSNSMELFPGSADIVFIPYLERMNASLAYYKGVRIRKDFPNIDHWFKALEKLDAYRGTQGDFHTHSHDLPPQMGGCWIDENSNQNLLSNKINSGEGLGEDETTFKPLAENIHTGIALMRVLKHRDQIKAVNPLGSENFDQPLRAALSKMVLNETYLPTKGSALGLRYLRDRICVPRDMPLLSARKLRIALEATAIIDGTTEGPSIPIQNRFDQDPSCFLKSSN
ncbi:MULTISPECIES: glutathione S-transferase family protein [unclassified Prochlorococcus]|uniref:glutathione S-transferase family protein n=1 Tax=unclassified Prochlorococcus TaxID=2627481 RepID=UPI00053377CC|nr:MULTISPECIES: glutathione S-transferase family protein [unclassified Prochlorococcus]KGG16390.1 Glutaredoxin-like domain/phycoerythrin related domain fusion [Prochlorococcus sp. MIT 0602]KGG17135.1 Glutaredoxin-like domain/phycoerythrin related domain fusion [Prochlorococcus sp. MIT 0603]